MFKIIKKIFRIALPAVGEMMLYMLIWVIDTMMVGNYGGETAVSAVGLSSEIFYTITNLFVGMGLGVGMTSIISRAMGAKDMERARRSSHMGIRITLYMGVAMFFIFYFYSW
ncbi:MAG: MATE family efflux transporter, partial [Fusobacteriaceae bacterium]